MLRDSMLLVNIQLAIMGIVVVAGLFYLWRMICRVEKKVDEFIEAMSAHDFFASSDTPVARVVSYGGDAIQDGCEDDEEADEFMKEVFGDATVVINSQPSFKTMNLVEIEEEQVAPSEAESTNTISKSKIKRMSVDALRDLCKEKGLSTDGTKAALQERLIDASAE